MHDGAMEAMKDMLARAPENARTVLDVGSLDVNGTYKPLIENRGWRYTGIDIQGGDNVDYIVPPYDWPFDSESFDVVISGSTLEHVERPWCILPEMVRVLRPGGLLAILTHHTFPFHNYPWDCWRFFPHAFEVLFNDTHLLRDYDIRIISETDIIGSAIRI